MKMIKKKGPSTKELQKRREQEVLQQLQEIDDLALALTNTVVGSDLNQRLQRQLTLYKQRLHSIEVARKIGDDALENIANEIMSPNLPGLLTDAQTNSIIEMFKELHKPWVDE